jgi:hypothetical protein
VQIALVVAVLHIGGTATDIGFIAALPFGLVTLNALWSSTMQVLIAGQGTLPGRLYDWLVSLVIMPVGYAVAARCRPRTRAVRPSLLRPT